MKISQIKYEAVSRGLKVYSWNLHGTSDISSALSDSWQELDFRCDQDGNPTHDSRGNPVLSFNVRAINENDDDELLYDWWGN